MPMINGHFYSIFGHYSIRVSNMIQRYRLSAANDQAEANTSFATSSFNDASTNLAQGMAALSAKAAIKRMQDEAAAKAQATTNSVDLSV